MNNNDYGFIGEAMTDRRKLVFEIVLAAIILGGMVLLAGLWK